ncbi:hypothetical protein DFA_02712 [Cavenderia fasciculata]|uniref:Leucine-rich repeat-containing protein n=1 Tax=Cavenderia fasciculata TaxID=261658 RepID=F4PHY2_CACFS|nr:uncharacterized protein DFA_02712 [Cavenderia fasciculata]EGG24469.1 hypothetical protein DFA_02712 [Cavenderia fasciculata]|eukprot:XP_004362320.1 hypothetical protein DFA_02712 [Cavenderia fasciculata]
MTERSLKQTCLSYLLQRRESIPKNVNMICEIPEIREEFVNLSKRKNLVDDQFFSVFGDIFIGGSGNNSFNQQHQQSQQSLHQQLQQPQSQQALHQPQQQQQQQQQLIPSQTPIQTTASASTSSSSSSAPSSGQCQVGSQNGGQINIGQYSNSSSSSSGVNMISSSANQGGGTNSQTLSSVVHSNSNINTCTQQQQQKMENGHFPIVSSDNDIEMIPSSIQQQQQQQQNHSITNNNHQNNNYNNTINNQNNNNNLIVQEIDLSLLGRLTDISIQFLTKYTNLVHLNVSFCTGLSSEFVKFLAAVPEIQLQSLNLYNTNTTDTTLQLIVSTYSHSLRSIVWLLLKCTQLQHLDISHCRKLTSATTKNLTFPNLLHLNASWIPTTETKESSFHKCVKACPKLTTLTIAASGISEAELLKILIEGGKRLLNLDISYSPNSITSIDSKVFKHMSQLQSLTLAGCSFKEPILRRIIESTPNLKELDISHQDGVLPWSLLMYIVSDSNILQHLHMINLSQSKFDKFDIETLLHYPNLKIYLPSV